MPPVIEQSGLNWVDLVILGIIVISSGISLLRGFFKEAISLTSWVIAFWVAIRFSGDQAALLEPLIETPSLRTGVAFTVLIFVTLIVGSLVGRAVQGVVDFAGLGGIDHLMGMIFGAAKGGLIVVVMVVLAGLTALPQDPWWKASMLLPYFQEASYWLQNYFPEHLRGYFSYYTASL